MDCEIVTLRCIECENSMCGLARKYVPVDSLEGCTRKLNEETAAKYHHYINEVWPMMNPAIYSLDYIGEKYAEIIEFLNSEIYTSPIGQKLNKNGKIAIR